MLGCKRRAKYIDQSKGDDSIIPVSESSLDNYENEQATQSVIHPKRIINFKEVQSNQSDTTEGQSHKIIEIGQQYPASTSQQKESQQQHTFNKLKYSTFKIQNKETEQMNQYNFRMQTSAFSRLFMFDYLKLLIYLYKTMQKSHNFQWNSLPQLESKEQISYQYDKFSLIYYKKLEKLMNQGKEFNGNDMLIVLLKTHMSHFITMGVILVFFFTCKILSSLCIRELLNVISSQNTVVIYKWTALICISLLAVSMLDQFYVRVLVVQYQSLRILLMKHIQTKVSSLSSFTINQNNIGQLMNLVSNDLKILETKTGEILKLPILPLPTIAAGIISYQRFGIYSIVGLAFLIACVPIQTLLGKMSKKFFKKRAAVSDQRIQLTNEILESIRLIKLYSWEEAFLKMVKVVRSKDLRLLFATKIIQIIENSISLASGIFSCFLIFYLVLQFEDSSSLTLANMYSTLDIFLFLRQEVISSSGIGIAGLFEIKVIMKRIVNILSIESKEMLSLNQQEQENDLSKSQVRDSGFSPIGEVILKNFNAYWKPDIPVLMNINTHIQPGELVSITGPVSSGKTSLLSCFIKEMPYYTGVIEFKGKIAYVEQEPYIFNLSFRDNIIFGSDFDEDLYERVIGACDHQSDIDILGGDDLIEIGEKGSNLSGGQRARLALARALYSQADIYLLDDPLSALDSNVSKKIFINAIQMFLKGKTVIFVTHSLDLIQKSDRVIALDGGYVIEQGDPVKLVDNLEELQTSPSKSPLPSPSANTSEGIINLIQSRSKQITKRIIKSTKDSSFQSLKEKTRQQLCSYNQLNGQSNQQIDRYATLRNIKISQEEGKENQKVSFKTYRLYFNFCKHKWLFPICVILFMSNEVSYILFTQTVGKFNGNNQDEYSQYITLLGIYCFAYFAIMLLKRSLINFLINDINFNLHQEMVRTILRSRIAYFDRTPIGSIVNRFSTDLIKNDNEINQCIKKQGNLDTDLSKSLTDSLEVVSNTLTLITTLILLNPYFIIIAVVSGIVLGLFFHLAKNVLIATKQFDLNLKSSVFTFFNTNIAGILPIKIFNQTTQFRLQFNRILDDSLRSAYTYWFTNRGFGIYIIFIAQISSIIGIFMAISMENNPTNLGSTITFFISLGYKLQSGLRQVIQLDVVMSSAQRAINLTQLEEEAELRTKYDNKFIQKGQVKRFPLLPITKIKEIYDFPTQGKIEFKNVSMSYNEDKRQVLNGVSFQIEPGQKVAFIGRTGAGKSSILQALFRMFELQKNYVMGSQLNFANNQTQKLATFFNLMETEANVVPQQNKTIIMQENYGSNEQADPERYIKIDGHYIDDIGIKTLRDSFSIIPQIPFIFSGTIRINIDPYQIYTDHQIWEAMKEIQLEQKIKGFPKGLETEISNSSESFSAGQKQLICLARAMLKNSKILVLDEITSNCDAYTEDLILQLIKKKFLGCTIITIAHRLNTIADYDKIIVLDQGKVAESGTSDQLLSMEGIFAKMVNSSGQKTSNLIRKVIRNKVLMLNYLEVPQMF